MLTKKCQLCDSNDLELIIDLGYHPLADTFLSKKQLEDEESYYPLRVLLCKNCGYATLQYIVPAEIRYQKNDYSYTSGNSPVAIKHFNDLSKQVIEKVGLSSKDLVVDIGSNDGTLLKSFKNQIGCQVMGVEPSFNIAKIAKKNKIPTINSFFDRDAVEKILKKNKARAITCNNTFNHITDLNEFIENINNLLDDDGFFVFETPYLPLLAKESAFDTIYLEHVSYFSVKPFVRFFKKFNLHIAYIEQNDYMGGSVRVYLSKNNSDEDLVKKYCEREKAEKIYDTKTYKDFMSKVEDLRFNLCHRLYQIRSRGDKIIGIGAATKGNTLLNYCKIDNRVLDFITDNSPLKIGKFTPGVHIPIKSDEDIDRSIKFGLILPWNIGDFLKEKLKHLNLEFIIPRIKK